MRYAFIRTHEQTHRVSRLCRALAVSRSGYYAWRDRSPSARAVEDRRLLAILRQIHRERREEYGAVTLWREAMARGIRCGRHRVARLRKLGGLETQRVRASASSWSIISCRLRPPMSYSSVFRRPA